MLELTGQLLTNLSPNSLEAIMRLGFTIEDLLYVDYKEFKAKNSDLIGLEEEVKRLKYEYLEEKRHKRIEMCRKVKQDNRRKERE
jgi:hypothetical protein